jgi:hypothetical protein
MLNLDEEICKQIAEAIVQRWIEKEEDYLKVMKMVFDTRSAKETTEKLTREFVESGESCNFFCDILEKVEKKLTVNVRGIFQEFCEMPDYADILDEWKTKEANDEYYEYEAICYAPRRY